MHKICLKLLNIYNHSILSSLMPNAPNPIKNAKIIA